MERHGDDGGSSLSAMPSVEVGGGAQASQVRLMDDRHAWEGQCFLPRQDWLWVAESLERRGSRHKKVHGR